MELADNHFHFKESNEKMSAVTESVFQFVEERA